MYRYAALFIFLSCGIVHGIELNVMKDGKLCLYADLMVNFSVSYEATDSTTKTVEFPLPASANGTESVCYNGSSVLKFTFGNGHSWTMNFLLSNKTYQADSIVFVYNLKDETVFPNASSTGVKNATVKPHITDIAVDTCYSCKSKETIEDKSANQTLWNVHIQAFVTNGNKSEELTVCKADQPTPTPTTPSTTPAPTPTNTTSVPTPTNTTSVPTPTTTSGPTPTLPSPTTGNYNVTTGVNGSVCLLASFGLRIGVKGAGKYEEMNLNPAGTNVSGLCAVNSSELTLVSSTMTVVFTFTNDSKKFHLQGLTASGKMSSGESFTESNSSLNLWQASLSSSYMCNNEQNFTINNNLSVFTFNLRVQPFAVKGGVFSTAHECFLDSDLSFLVPIAVGVALSFLIILVLISYLIGRRKSRTGYQSV